jgi:hypothetical protein
MFKKLEVAVPEVRFQFYSFQPDARYEEQFLPESWVDQTQVGLITVPDTYVDSSEFGMDQIWEGFAL